MSIAYRLFCSWQLTHSTWNRNPSSSQTIWQVNFHITGKVWESTDNFQLLLYLTNLESVKTLAIPNVWEYKNSHIHHQAVSFWGNLGICFPSSWKMDGNIFPSHPVNPYHSQNMGKVNSHSFGNANIRKISVP